MNRLANYRPRRGKGRPAPTRAHATHQVNPSGSKLLRRFAKTKLGTRTSAAEAADWYTGYLADADRKASERDEQRKLARAARRA